MNTIQNLETAPINTRRTRLSDILDGRIEDEDGSLLEQEFQNVDESFELSKSHRWLAKSTQAQQDKTLSEYRQWMSGYLARSVSEIVLPNNSDADEMFDPSTNDKYIFPANHTRFCEYVGKYLLMAAANVKSSIRKNKSPSVVVLRQRRNNMFFWMTEMLPPAVQQPRWAFLRDTAKAYSFAAHKYGLSKRRASAKLFFGKNELEDLIDFDFETSRYTMVAAQHHLAWCLAWISGLRPGSLAKVRFKDDTLLWKDIKIIRVRDAGVWKGSFTAKITIRNLKRNKDNPDAQNFEHQLTITSPRFLKNLPLSVPHRLLLELLRRDLLEDCSDVDALLANNNDLNVKIKAEAMDQPVFLAAMSGGRRLTKEPMSSEALTSYLSRRALYAGYPDGVTMYAWRRGAGTKVALQEGADAARTFLTHDPGSHTFERYYDGRKEFLDLFGIAADEDQLRNAHRLAGADSPALHTHYEKVAEQAIARRGLVEAWLNEDENIRALVTANNMRGARLERKRLRRLAMKAIYDEARSLAASEATLDSIEQRKAEMWRLSKVFGMIKERVSQLQQDGRDADTNRADDEEIDELVDEATTFRDLEDDLRATDRAQQIEPEALDDVDIDDIDAETWLKYVRHFAELLLNDQEMPPGEPRICPLCTDDEYVDDEYKAKMWKNYSTLEKHLVSAFHRPHRSWIRRMNATQLGSDGRYTCPYGCQKTYARIDNLEAHILEARIGSDGVDEKHEAGKIKDGWYNEDFNEDKRPEAVKEQRRNYQRELDGFIATDEHDEVQLRYVDDDANRAVTIGGGLPHILRNATAVTKQAEDVNRMTKSLGWNNGRAATIDQLNQLSKAASHPVNVKIPKTVFKTGQGFDPKEFSKRLIEPPKSASKAFTQSIE